MTYKALLTANGTRTWSIDLATHLGTAIPNETTDASLAPNGIQVQKEQQFAKFTQCQQPVAGYNCFGHVFAGRRTAIYWDTEDVDIQTVLSEDGYTEITDEADVKVGDIVVYSDDRAPLHVAVVVRLSDLVSGTGQKAGVVRSKFGDQTGEYEHLINDTSWDNPKFRSGEMRIQRYRARHALPCKKPPKPLPTWQLIVSGGQ